MALKSNGRNSQALPLRFRGTVGFEYAETNKASQRNIFASVGYTDDKQGVPSGYLYPSAWIWPQTSGAISSFSGVRGEGSVTGTLAGGVNIVGTVTGSGTLTATGELKANMVGNCSGSSTVSATLSAIGYLDSTISSTSTVTGDLTAVTIANLSASIGGSSTLTADWTASLYGVININDNVGTVYGIPTGPAFITCNISPFTELSPQNLADAVWSASKNDYLIPDTMGVELKKKLNKTDFLALKD